MTSLVKKIERRLEAAAGKTPRAAGVYVLFDNATPGLDQELRALAEKHALKRVFLAIGAAPKDYDISIEADVTVVIYNVNRRNDQHVTANFALRKGALDAATSDAIVAAISQMLP